MSQVIICIENPTLRDLISVNLKSYMGATIIPRSNAEDVIGILEVVPEIQLVIADAQNSQFQENTVEIIQDYVDKNKLEIALISMGTTEGIKATTIVIEEVMNWEKTVDEASKVMGVTIKGLKDSMVMEYSPITTSYLLAVNECCCDVFIRIRKNDSDYQFVKRLHAYDSYTRETIEKYIDSGLIYFYIPKKDESQFYTYISNRLVENLEKNETNIDNNVQKISVAHDLSLKELKRKGFSTTTIQLTDSTIHAMEESIKKSEYMGKLLGKIINSPTSIIYQSSHLCLMLVTEIINHRSKQSEEELERLALASFFKDATLIEKPEYSLICDKEGLESIAEDESLWQEVFIHAHDSANLVSKHPQAPVDTDTIIRQHHGSLSGRGFSMADVENIREDAKLLLVADTFARFAIDHENHGIEKGPLISQVERHFIDFPSLHPVVKELNEALKKRAAKS